MRGNILAHAVKGPRPLLLIYTFIYLSFTTALPPKQQTTCNWQTAVKQVVKETWICERNVFRHLSKGKSKPFAIFRNRNYYEGIGTEYGISSTFMVYFVSERWLIYSYVFLVLWKLPCQWHSNRLRDITESQTLFVPINALLYILCILMSFCS